MWSYVHAQDLFRDLNWTFENWIKELLDTWIENDIIVLNFFSLMMLYFNGWKKKKKGFAYGKWLGWDGIAPREGIKVSADRNLVVILD